MSHEGDCCKCARVMETRNKRLKRLKRGLLYGNLKEAKGRRPKQAGAIISPSLLTYIPFLSSTFLLFAGMAAISNA